MVPHAIAAAVTLMSIALAASPAEGLVSDTTATDPPPVREQASSTSTPPFQLGALAGVGFPRPISFEAFAKLSGYIEFGCEYGLLPTINLDGVAASSWAFSVDTRVFPFRGAFFLGLRGGYQNINASATVSAYSESAQQETWFINPRLGFQWTVGRYFTIATEAGVQLPVSSSFPRRSPLPWPSSFAIKGL